MNVQKIGAIDINMLQQVLSSSKITETQKANFIRNNKSQIEKVIRLEITPG